MLKVTAPVLSVGGKKGFITLAPEEVMGELQVSLTLTLPLDELPGEGLDE
jgi:hypothetical protein